MAHLDELKDVLVETLDRRGVLNEVRGRLRAEVFKALDDEAAPKPKLSNENVLINELIREYLIYNKYRYSEMTLRSESGLGDLPLNRDFLESEVKIRTSGSNRQLPLLYHLILGKSSNQQEHELHPSTELGAD